MERVYRRKILGREFEAILLQSPVAMEAEKVHVAKLLGREVSFVQQGMRARIQGVRFRELMELSLELHSCRDLLWVFAQGKASSLDRFKKIWQQLPLSLVLPPGARVGIRVESSGSHLYHEGRLTKVAESILMALGFQVVPFQSACHRVYVLLANDILSLCLSMGGKPLYRRGYRQTGVVAAPLSEHLAYSLIRKSLSSQGRFDTLVVPFAGSGTLMFESLIFSQNLPSGWRKDQAFREFFCTPKPTLNYLDGQMVKRFQAEGTQNILAFERCQNTQKVLLENVESFFKPLERAESSFVLEGDFFSYGQWPEGMGEVFIPLNPPWGKRLPREKITAFYEAIAFKINEIPARRKTGFILGTSLPALKSFQKAIKNPKSIEWVDFLHSGQKLYALFFSV